MLREAGMRKGILVLGYTFPYAYERMISEEISVTVFREDMLEQLSQAAERAGKKARVHIKVDTGMGRIGITPDEQGILFCKKVCQYPMLATEGIFTHFARADETDKSVALQQYELFDRFVQMAEEQGGCNFVIRHCANSAAILELPAVHKDAVRAGIAMYGLWPSAETDINKCGLKPALSWYSRIVYLKTVQAGQSISYGGLFTADREMKVATVPIGYGDGYPRMLTGKGYVLVNGRKAPILGRICMDQFMIDVTDIDAVAEGDVVTVLGTDGELCITAEEIGALCGRFNYELVCDISKRVPRVYVKDGRLVGTKDYYHDI